MTREAEVATLVLQQARASAKPADALHFAEVEIGNLVRAEIEKDRQADRAALNVARANIARLEAEAEKAKAAAEKAAKAAAPK